MPSFGAKLSGSLHLGMGYPGDIRAPDFPTGLSEAPSLLCRAKLRHRLARSRKIALVLASVHCAAFSSHSTARDKQYSAVCSRLGSHLSHLFKQEHTDLSAVAAHEFDVGDAGNVRTRFFDLKTLMSTVGHPIRCPVPGVLGGENKLPYAAARPQLRG
jgi:hypothetical protein